MCCSGDKTAKAAEQAQAAFTQTLQSSFSTAFANNQAILNNLTQTLTNAINNPKGFDPKTLALMKTNVNDTVSNSVRNAQIASTNAAAARSGPDLGSGVDAQVQGQIAGTGVAARAQNLSQIDIQNGLLQNQNYWSAIQGLTNVAAAENPTGYAGAANQGAGEVANLSNAVLQSQQAGWQNAFGVVSGIAGLGLSAVGAYNSLGFGGATSGSGSSGGH